MLLLFVQYFDGRMVNLSDINRLLTLEFQITFWR